MKITIWPEQEQLLRDAIDSGLARNAADALDQALDGLRRRLPKPAPEAESTAATARRIAS